MSLNPPIFLKEKEENNSKFVEIQHSQTTSIAAEDPLQNLRLASQEVLQKAQQSGRSKCLKCGGSRMFYCYTCYVPVENVPIEQMPLVKLPLKIDIIKHPNETDGKSTAIHAKLLAPEFVNIYTYPCIPEYEEKDHEVALVFPGPKSVSIKDISFHLQKRIQNNVKDKNDDPDKPFIKRKKTEEQDLNDGKGQDTTLKKIIFIDSTWNQTNKIFTDERLQALDGLVCIPRMIRRQESYPVGFRQLPKSFLQAIVKNALHLEKKVYDTFWNLTYGLLQVELKTRKTCFWRHQKGKPDTFLSTIEAIYYFLVDYHTDILKEKYQGQYDNLLFFYSFMYQLIKNAKCSGDKETRKLIH